MALSDRITVLRDGQLIATVDTGDLTPDAIAEMMVGRELSNLYPPKNEPDVDAPVILDVEGLTAPGVRGVSFALRRGEILGFAGLDQCIVAHVRDDDIGLGDKIPHQGLGLGMLEINAQRALVAVEIEVFGRKAAR